MKLPENILNEFNAVKEKGDIKKLMKITEIKTHAHMSRIMSGKDETIVSKVAKIKKFVLDKKKEIKQIESDMI